MGSWFFDSVTKTSQLALSVADLTRYARGDCGFGRLDELVLVMRAAVAREKLDQGESVSPAELAILASASAIAVRALCRDGEIRATNEDGWTIAAEEAKRFLSTRS